ncbi:MAG TPA: TIM barrel protein, partial [Pirellulaceae bacterium]|nr:TIM barrel protein [Pirellulaceae bacterium]
MFLGYNTNGLAHHDPFDAVALLAELGYQGIALTIDHGLCSPRDSHWQSQAAALRRALEQANMRSVIETGARYLLNPRVKHAPTLVSPRAEERAGRSAFLRHAIDVAVELGSDCVSFWSGIVQDGADDATAEARLISAIQPVVEYAASRAVVLAFEPEPGMFIDTMARFQWLH